MMAKQSLTHNGNNTESQPSAEKPEVSVIVPVYNVEPYLRRCIDSLIGQTLQNIEIILVDDSSTDGCGRICDEYAARDSRIRVIHQENSGQSEARNAGIDTARADYLMFVDSDDWVEPGFCEIPLMAAKEYQADLVMFLSKNIKNGRTRSLHCSVSEGLKTQAEALNLILESVGMSSCNKLYHRDLFLTNRYPKGRVYEDVVLTPVLVHEANRIFSSSSVLYNREYREGSTTTILTDSYAKDWFNATVLLSDRLKSWGFSAESEYAFQARILGFLSKKWNSPELNQSFICYFQKLKHCPKRFSSKQRHMYYMLKLSPRLYQFACRLCRTLRP